MDHMIEDSERLKPCPFCGGVAHGRAQAASAAEETVRATIIVGGETPDELLTPCK